MTCEDIFLEVIVKVQAYKSGNYTIPVPPNVGNISEITGATFGTTPDLQFTMNGNEDDTAKMGEGSSIEDSESNTVQGKIHSIATTVNIESGFQLARNTIQDMIGTDYITVVTTQLGNSYLAYHLPNTSDITIKDDIDTEIMQMSVKLSGSSRNGFIKLN